MKSFDASGVRTTVEGSSARRVSPGLDGSAVRRSRAETATTVRPEGRSGLRRSNLGLWLLVGVSVAALLAGAGGGVARPLNGGGGSRGGEQSAAAAAAAAAAAVNRQGAEAAKLGRDSLVRTRRSIEAMRAAQQAAREAARQAGQAAGNGRSDVPNGLVRGGLDPAVTAPRPSPLDPTGTATWQGAKLPTEVVKDGRHDVTVEQTASRAILSWKTFNVGKDTTLTFDQDGNKDWVVLNRIVGGLDSRGRRTAELRPSEILGSIKADGAVLVLNQNGTLFGAGAQINVNALGVTTAEIGRGFRVLPRPGGLAPEFEALTLAERNAEFLQFGLLGVRDSLTPEARAFHSDFMPFYDDVLIEGVRDVVREGAAPSGAVLVEAGARIKAGEGGFVLLNSTRVENAGEIVAPEGVVSLVAQWGASLIASDGGGKNGNDPNYRGLAGFAPVDKIAPTGASVVEGGLSYFDGTVEKFIPAADIGEVYGRNTGLIRADRGSIRVTENSGVLASTTSVSRNGYIAVDRAMAGSTISITADEGEETVPQDPLSLANFKTSRVDIGYYVGEDALVYAPGGDVVFTGPPRALSLTDPSTGNPLPSATRVLIESGAVIDVGGLRDVLVPASRNAIRIGPLKGNELADNPDYRDSFLNGATIYVDPRRSGVRADGVAWVGSPLVEAESYYQQVGVKAEELLTRGGNVRFGDPRATPAGAAGDLVSDTIVEAGAVIDISGGSVRYEGGQVRTSKLLGADGRVYDVADADPLKMAFIGFASGFTVANDRFGIVRSWSSTLRPDTRTELAFTEGRDGGSLDLPDGPLAFEGAVKAGVVVGDRQIRDAVEGTGESAIGWDLRPVQGAPSQLPVGGALRIAGDPTRTDGFTNGVKIMTAADIAALPDLGYGRDFSAIDAGLLPADALGAGGVSGPRDPDAALPEDRLGASLISSEMLSEAGFGQIEIARRGDISIEEGASVRLADGGLFTAASGGSIRVDGSIIAASGVVSLETSGQSNLTLGNSDLLNGLSSIPDGYSPWDVVVNGTISVRGRWVNEFGAPDSEAQGRAYIDGGSIVLYAGSGAGTTDTFDSGIDPLNIRDISGSVLVNAGARLDLAGGGRVDREGVVDTSAKGGSLSLISEANYSKIKEDNTFVPYPTQHVGDAQQPGGLGNFVNPIPDKIIAEVSIDSGATILSHGFGGGGTLQLVTPDFAFGDGDTDVGTRLPMSFINAQGFSNYEITSFKTKIIESKFQPVDSNFDGVLESRGYDAFLETQTVAIGADETLRLRNSVFSLLPSERSSRDLSALQGLGSGGDLYSVLETTTLDDTPDRDNAFYRQPVNLSLGGLIELKVEKGGAVIGEAGATLGVNRLINEGLIRLPGGRIVQRETLSRFLARNPFATRDPYAELTPEADGTYSEFTPSKRRAADRTFASNRDVYQNGYILGELGADVGVALRDGSVTDVAGVSLRDPLARDGARAGDDLASGRILAGGSIVATEGADRNQNFKLFPTNPYARFSGGGAQAAADIKRILGLKIEASPGASIDISGASDVYDRLDGAGMPGPRPTIPTPVWSDAGAVVAPNGGTLTGALIDARGGNAKARGGTLEIRDLVLTQTDTRRPAANTISADLITRSGFDVVHARGSLTSIGDVDLTLDRGFFLSANDFVNQTGVGSGAEDQSVRISSGGALSIVAPYVRLEGFDRSVESLPEAAAGPNSATFSADQVDIVGGVLFDPKIGSVDIRSKTDIRLLGQRDPVLRLPADGRTSETASDAIGMQLAAYGDLTLTADRVYAETGATALVTSSGADATITFERPRGPAPSTPYSAGSKLTIQAAHIVQNGALFAPHGSLTLGATSGLQGADSFGSLVEVVPATKTVTLGDGSLTSVSGGKISIPYGVTTDLTEYFFTPGGSEQLEGTPEKRLILGGSELSVEAGATIDVSGGGDVFAYEFIPGTGGSRDVLDRLNPDDFSSNDGLTYPDGRQVYAIVPGLSDATVAAHDPLFSAGYDDLDRTSGAGSRVYLSGGAGLAAGWYTLLPAKYAVLPGGVRVVAQPGGDGLTDIGATPLPDGTIRVSGRYGQLGSADWRWRRFDLQPQAVFRKYSNIALTSAQKIFADRAAAAGEVAPRLPRDAGAIQLDAITRLNLDGEVKSNAAKRGRGTTVDVGGRAIYVVSDPDAVTVADGTVLADGAVVREIDGALRLCADASSECAAGSDARLADVAPLLVGADDLSGLGAESLLIGGSRVTRDDGAVEIRTSAQRVVVANDAETPLYAPEILAAVGFAQNKLVDPNGNELPPTDPNANVSADVRGGPSKALIVMDGAVVEARGAVADPSTTDYVAAGGWVGDPRVSGGDAETFRRVSVGAVLRVANGPERLIRREDTALDAFEAPTSDPALIAQYQRRYSVDLDIADGARLTGGSVLADVGTYRNPTLSVTDPNAVDESGTPLPGGSVGWTPRADLSIGLGAAVKADVLTLGAGRVAISDRPVAGGGLAVTRDLIASLGQAGKVGRLSLLSQQAIGIDGGVWRFGDLTLTAPGLSSRDGADVVIKARDLGLGNAAANLAACAGAACGDATLSMDAREIVMGPGQVSALGFGGGVTLAAEQGIFARGVGGLDVGSAALRVETPVIADRAFPNADPSDPTLPATGVSFSSDAAVVIVGATSEAARAIAGAPGASISIEGGSVSISGSRIRATAGAIAIAATDGDVSVSDGAVVEAPGYDRVFGEVTRSSPGGSLRLESVGGDVVVGAGATVSVGGGKGKAGALALIASDGEVVVAGALDGLAAEGNASIAIDTGGPFDLGRFAETAAALNFDGRIAIRSGTGDLRLDAGDALTAESVALTADGGGVELAGLIDTSGVSGGDVALFGRTGVRLEAGARIDAGASGYAANDTRRAKAGSVTLGTDGEGAIALAEGAVIDVSADRKAARLVPFQREGKTYYTYVEADRGGTVSFRAPVIEREGADTVRVTANGRVDGAHEIVLEAFKRWDLDAVADSGDFKGVTRDENGITLDVRTDLDQLAFDSATGRVAVTDAGAGVNFLGDRGAGTIVSYIQDFDVSGAFAGLGGLAEGENFHARAGVELASRGDVTLASNWNLGAGVVDVDGALAARVMEIEPLTGKASVVFGREGDLLNDHTAMIYRTGARATGEAAVLSLRAGGDLAVKGTISDGFFQFRNQTDPDFLGLAMAGGKQYYRVSPDVSYSAGASVEPDEWRPGEAPGNAFVTFNFNFGSLGENDLYRTERPSTAPYSALANTAASIGDDAAGSAELFPLIGGESMDASSYRLVAGADRDSVDPAKTSAGASGTVSVEGLNSYVMTPAAADQVRFLEAGLGLRQGGGSSTEIETFLEAFALERTGLDDRSFVSIGSNFDPAVLDLLVEVAREALPADGFSVVEPDGNTVFERALTMPYGSVRGFLAAVGSRLDRFNVPSDPQSLPNPVGGARTAHYRNLVRTGAGRIDVAAAGSVDLRGGAEPVFVSLSSDNLDVPTNVPPTAGSARQIGGSAVYSAGRRASLETRRAVDPSGRLVAVDPGALPAASNSLKDGLATFDYDPNPNDGNAVDGPAGILVADLVFAEGGGDVAIAAGVDVLGERDYARAGEAETRGGLANEPWRQGQVSPLATVRINAQGFYDGVGALGGGDVSISAGRDVSNVTAVATASLASGATTADGLAESRALLTLGGGDVSISAARDLLGGRVDVASGEARIDVGQEIASGGLVYAGDAASQRSPEKRLALRLSDATVDVWAGRAAVIDDIESLLYYSENSEVSLTANGDLTVRNPSILPGSLRTVSAAGDLTIGDNLVEGRLNGSFTTIASPRGRLELLAAGDIGPTRIAMSDQDASLLQGVFSSFDPANPNEPGALGGFAFPNLSPALAEGEQRAQHAETPVHADDPNPVLVSAGRDITGMILAAPKEARVSAGRDIVDMVFFGQNLDERDVTRIAAGRDITATTRLLGGRQGDSGVAGPALSTVQGNTFRMGGPGSFILEAGRNAGPFLNSATISTGSGSVDYGGGVLSVGNEDNPWLAPDSADVTVMFGVGKGVAWAKLRDHYLDPANASELDDVLFEQVGGAADRTRPIYGVKLLAWMKANEPEALEEAAGAGSADLAAAYKGFTTLAELRQRAFLTDVYFGELIATADPEGPSFERYQRGYEAVNLLFPAELGYTKNDLEGGSNGANEQIVTGDLDLRLASIQTSQGGDIRLMGPGGRVLAGSTVRTAQQIARRNYYGEFLFGLLTPFTRSIAAIPTGYEGLLTIAGGSIYTFTDGDVLLNQSRLFTQAGGDVAMWSSNGDLNGGEGPKTSSNFPPVTVDVSYDGFSTVASRGSATGAGIAAFEPAPGVPAPDVYLIAPRGTVDAGAAGIRVSGNLNIAAQTVANADNIQVGGVSVGVPTVATASVGALTAASNASAAASADGPEQGAGAEQASIIIVEVLGYGGGDGQKPDCPPEQPDCKPQTP